MIKNLYWSALDLYTWAVDSNPKPAIVFDAIIGQIKCNLALGNLGKVKTLIKEAEKIWKTIDLYIFGANVTLKLEQYKECVDYCKQALKIDIDYQIAKDLMNNALNSMIAQQKKQEAIDQQKHLDSIILIRDLPFK